MYLLCLIIYFHIFLFNKNNNSYWCAKQHHLLPSKVIKNKRTVLTESSPTAHCTEPFKRIQSPVNDTSALSSYDSASWPCFLSTGLCSFSFEWPGVSRFSIVTFNDKPTETLHFWAQVAGNKRPFTCSSSRIVRGRPQATSDPGTTVWERPS